MPERSAFRLLQAAAGPRNWALVLGALLVLVVAIVALAGPDIAPRDPLQESFVARNNAGVWIQPPYLPFTVPGYPLGSDEFGRDLLSQLLWAVRPTLTLVLVVAALRLTLGIGVGLAAGWVRGRIGRWLDTAISAGLAVPVMFVALCVVALAGADWGVWAFIFGLALTGWAESARLLRAQARTVKQQPYVEAARALGSSDVQLIYRHVLPQVMPLVWVTLAFEVSATLLTVAALGVLGYFINSVWVALGDWTAIRASGQPELGQMLATAFAARERPWGLFVAGSAVFIIVMAFNLLGEGLRHRLSQEGLRRRQPEPETISGQVTEWVEGRLFDPLSSWRRTATIGTATGALLSLILGGGFALWRSSFQPRNLADLPIPGDHLWASAYHDPYGTLRSEVNTLQNPQLAWSFEDATGLGGPSVAADGTIYVSSFAGELIALDSDGQVQWRAPLPAPPFGTPALNELGDILVADQTGGLTAFRKDGTQLWSLPGTGSPAIASPVVGADGTIYYPTDGQMVAVTLDGYLKWRVNLPFYAYTWPVVSLSPDGQYLLFEDVVLETSTGASLTDRTIEPFDRFFVGTDGEVYLGGTTGLLHWRTTEIGAEIAQRAQFDARGLSLGFRFLQSAGVTPEGRVWLWFNSEYEHGRVVWFDMQGTLRQDVSLPYTASRLLAVDANSAIYVCGFHTDGLECRAMAAEEADPLWKVVLPNGGFVSGAALVPERLYVTTATGQLFALESARGAATIGN